MFFDTEAQTQTITYADSKVLRLHYRGFEDLTTGDESLESLYEGFLVSYRMTEGTGGPLALEWSFGSDYHLRAGEAVYQISETEWEFEVIKDGGQVIVQPLQAEAEAEETPQLQVK